MNKPLIDKIEEALKNAKEFIECDLQHPNREIVAYAERVIQEIDASDAAIAELLEKVDDVELMDALNTYERALEDDTLNEEHLDKYDKQTHHSLADATETLLSIITGDNSDQK